MSAPGYWMHETTGVLRPAVESYLHGGTMLPEHIAAMRAYLRQWIISGDWLGDDDLWELRLTVDNLVDRASITRWLNDACELGIDPL